MNPDPKSNLNSESAAAPLWLIAVFAGLLYGGMLYVDRNGGDFNAQVYAPYHSLAELQTCQPAKGGDEEVIRLGEQRYAQTCGQCHQASGLGALGQFPPLAGSEWVNEPDPARLIRIALNGAQGPITVKGQDWNLVMSLNATTLAISDKDLAAILTYVRQAWGNKAPTVTAEQIAQIKGETKGRAVQWTAAELNAVPVKK
ncbi:MAG: cytochrome c [Verrucomicrobia bacterium]|nr:cytochrome c [Verrucomicrobiota bacterium]